MDAPRSGTAARRARAAPCRRPRASLDAAARGGGGRASPRRRARAGQPERGVALGVAYTGRTLSRPEVRPMRRFVVAPLLAAALASLATPALAAQLRIGIGGDI